MFLKVTIASALLASASLAQEPDFRLTGTGTVKVEAAQIPKLFARENKVVLVELPPLFVKGQPLRNIVKAIGEVLPHPKEAVPTSYDVSALTYIRANDLNVVYFANGIDVKSRKRDGLPIFTLNAAQGAAYPLGLIRFEYTDAEKLKGVWSLVELKAKVRRIIVFGTSWCTACPPVKSSLRSAGVSFEAVDCDAEADKARLYGVSRYPTTIVYENDQEVARYVGGFDVNLLKGVSPK